MQARKSECNLVLRFGVLLMEYRCIFCLMNTYIFIEIFSFNILHQTAAVLLCMKVHNAQVQ